LQKEEGFRLPEGDKRLAELRRRRHELDQFVTRLDKIVKKETDPRKRDMLGMIEQAGLLETQAEYAKAIDLYEKVLAYDSEQTKVRKRLLALRKAWVVRDREHARARAYIYETWPKLETPTDLRDGLPKVKAAFEVCKERADALSPLRILRANVSHTDQLRKRLATLRPRDFEDDRKEAEIIATLAKDLGKLHDRVENYLKDQKKPAD
jgi:hypothetical protein